MKKISIISYSGGLDSTSLLLHLLNKQYTIYALSFDYGQKHKIELEKAQKNIKYFNSKGFDVNHKILNISDSIGMLDSSLTNSNVDVPSGYYKEENMKSTVVPNRNAIFTSILYGYALSISMREDIYWKKLMIDIADRLNQLFKTDMRNIFGETMRR